ncbi:MAG: ABC transporter ATP-binding protein, partial [Peptostreptococcus porci]|nr:ABC transporter ATP-binding protein [Peptostreptococcus porci]
MNKVLSYYKKYILYILLMIVVLIVQVKFELLLPKYTSNIVNIGIQQDGLTDSIPKVMDETTYAMVLSLSEEKEKS